MRTVFRAAVEPFDEPDRLAREAAVGTSGFAGVPAVLARPVLRLLVGGWSSGGRWAAVFGLVGVMLVALATPAAAQGHGHTLEVPFQIGPLALKMALLYALPAVAGYALMRGFMGAPTRNTAVLVAVSAAVAVTMELLLASGFALPPIAAVLALAAAAAPVYLAFKADAPAMPWAVKAAPAVLSLAAVVAGALFVQAWADSPPAGERETVLHTGLIVGFAAVGWLTLALPAHKAARAGVLVVAAALGVALVGAGAEVAVLA